MLAQAAVDGKTNEIPMFTALLGQAGDLSEVLITADALHAQREHATWLRERGAHYLVTVKGNQPGLLAQLRSVPWKEIPGGHVSAGRAHGRIERRTVKVVTVTAGLAFPHAAQALHRPHRHWPARHGGPSATWSSASCAWPGTPVSPVLSGTPREAPHARFGCSQARSDDQ